MAMMTMLRNRMHVVIWSLLVFFLLSMTVGGLVGGANIIDQLLGRVNPAEAIGLVNGQKITPNQFNQAVNAQMDAIRNSGSQVSDQDLEKVRSQVWNGFIEEYLTKEAIEDLDISVSDEEIIYHLENNPPIDIQRLFYENNIFNEENYRQALKTSGMIDWTPIETWMKDYYIPRFKLQQYISMSSVVTENDIKEEFIKRNIDYTISAIHITNASIKDKVSKPTDEELLEDYKSRLEDFKRDEKRHISFISWPKVPTSNDTLRVKQEAIEIIMSYGEGDDFGALANIHTMDPSNQVTPDSGRGGDLGWFGKGQMVQAFEKATFNAKSGSVIGPILTQFGYHIIKVDSIKNKDKDNHQVKAKHILLNINMGQNTRTDLRRKATLFSYDAQDYGFMAAQDTHSVQMQPSNYLGQGDIFIAGLGPFRTAVKWSFSTDVGSISDPLETEDFYAVFTLDSISEEGIAPFEDVRSQVITGMERDRNVEASSNYANELKAKVETGSSFKSLTESNKTLEYVPSDKKKLSAAFISLGKSEQLIGALLNSEKNNLIGPVKTNRGYGIVKVLEISSFDSTTWLSKKDIIKIDLNRIKETTNYQNWMSNLKEKAEIVDNRKFHF
jgi:parvulin-like peptidyl-prolyl isomerase